MPASRGRGHEGGGAGRMTRAAIPRVGEPGRARQRPGARGEPVRMRSLRSGALVGEMARHAGLPRSADVVAGIDAVLCRASAETLARLNRDDPELAAAWHRMIAVALAEKLNRTDQLLQEA